ncbi:MAG: hypothetical protein Q8K75_03770 [Chlamydiales bacterium]|nr:hypothetical protein [Chlamydiales bacterium]
MPSSFPVGGGIDGPQYADYQDVTDQQQVAGASSSMKEKLMLMQDSLVLDIAKFSGDIKSYAAKAEAPIIAPYIKARTAGSLETTDRSMQQIEEEFIRLLEKLPTKLRILLLKNMSMPKGERDPELDGLERSLQQHVEVTLWAQKLLERHRRKSGDEEEEEGEHKGIFAEDDEDVLPADTLIPKTVHVPIALLDIYDMNDTQLKKQIQANTIFMLETQYGILKILVKSLPPNHPAKPILDPLPKLMVRMIKQAKAFVDLQNLLDYKKAKKIAIGLESLDGNIIEEQRIFLQRASSYGASGPSDAVISLAKSMLSTTMIGCNILRSEASVSALNTEGNALLHALVLTSTPTMGESLMKLLNKLSAGLVYLGVPENKAKVLEIATLVAITSMLTLSGEEAIPYLVAFEPEVASGLAFLEADEPNQEEEEAKQLTKTNLQEVARTTAVQLASGTLLIHHAAKQTITALLGNKSEVVPLVLELVILLASAISAQTLLEKIGGSGNELYAELTADTLNTCAEKLQHLSDEGALKISATQVINELRLGELSYQGSSIIEQLATREKTFESFGLRISDFVQGHEDLLELAAIFVIELTSIAQQRRQVVPTMNVI